MILAYVCTLWFAYYLLNYAEISKGLACHVKGLFHPKITQAMECSFCFAFWATLALYIVDWAPGLWVFIAPVGHLFVDLTYRKLAGVEEAK